MTDAALTAAWEAYHTHRCQQARAQLISRHLHWVKLTVARVATALFGPLIQYDELVSAGITGLTAAVDRFDPTREASFKTYAITMIRGAVYEAMRDADPLSRNTRAKVRVLDDAFHLLSLSLDRKPENWEVADYLGVTETEVAATIRAKGVAHPISFEDYALRGDDDGECFGGLESLISSDPSPHDSTLAREQRAALRAAMATLPEREANLLKDYFWRGKTFKQIGAEQGVSESRIFQVHGQAIRRLRAALAETRSLFE